jgi:hypothetical protein
LQLWPPLCVSTAPLFTPLIISFIILKVLVEHEKADAGDDPPLTRECDKKRERWGGDGFFGGGSLFIVQGGDGRFFYHFNHQFPETVD